LFAGPWGLLGLIACAATVPHIALADPPRVETESIEVPVQVSIPPTVGMEGTYVLEYEGSTLSVKPSGEDADLHVRIVKVTPSEKDKKHRYEIGFVGYRPGYYYLRDYLAVADEDPELPPMKVAVATSLGGEPSAELAPVEPPPMISPIRYRLLLVLVGSLWLVPFVWLGLRRLV
jgi:hypothetical protein